LLILKLYQNNFVIAYFGLYQNNYMIVYSEIISK